MNYDVLQFFGTFIVHLVDVWALDELAVLQGYPSTWVNNWTSHVFFEMYGVRWDFR